MQGSPTSGYSTIFNNPPCYFLGEWDSGSSISTSSFELKNKIKEELIYFFWPSSNCNSKLFLPTKIWKHTNNYFLILLLLPSLCDILQLSNLCLHNIPHPNFCLNFLLYLDPLWKFDDRWYRGGIEVRDPLEISSTNNKRMFDLFILWKFIPTKKQKQTKNCPRSWEPITPLSSNYTAQDLATYIIWKTRFNTIC